MINLNGGLQRGRTCFVSFERKKKISLDMNIVFRQLCHILIKKQPRMDAELPKVTLAADNIWGRRDFLYTLSACYLGCLLLKLW